MSEGDALIRATDLVRHYRTAGRVVQAVDGVDLYVGRGETLGLVGESGCGKSTLGRTLLRLNPVTGGRVIFDGVDITDVRGERLRLLRRQMQMVFQDPLASLNPRMRVGDIVGEPLRAFGLGDRVERQSRLAELFDLVALPAGLAQRYPAQLSGGQRQRVAIARALSVAPRFIVADEAVASLDVSVAAQIINLLDELAERLELSYLFISHDLSMVRHISDRVAVMYLGRIVETAGTAAVFTEPLHPYTVALMSASPGALDAGGERIERIVLTGDPPSPSNPPGGCRFHTRCPVGPSVRSDRAVCAEVVPMLSEVSDGHLVACHFPGTLVHVTRRAIDPDLGSPPSADVEIPVAIAGGHGVIRVAGSGPAVVMLHGMLADGQVARSHAPHGCRVATFDMRGHGAAPPVVDVADFHIDRFVDDVLAVLDALDRAEPFGARWRAATLVGMSMGAAVALRLALDHPERVGRVVLVGPAYDHHVPAGAPRELEMADAIDRLGLADFGLKMADRFAELGAPAHTVTTGFAFDRHDAVALVAAIRTVSQWAPFPDLDRVADLGVQIDVVAWPNDDLHPLPLAERVASLAGAEPILLDGVISVLSNPPAVADAISRAIVRPQRANIANPTVQVCHSPADTPPASPTPQG